MIDPKQVQRARMLQAAQGRANQGRQLQRVHETIADRTEKIGRPAEGPIDIKGKWGMP